MPPKYQILASALRADILDGVYQKRMLLPTEQLLCQQYQVSRQTVRQALALLASEGLIERRQGSGSHIRDLSQPAPIPHRTVAVVTTYISDYIFPSILREVEDVLSANNSTPMLYATQNQVATERNVLKALLNLDHDSLDGVLVEGTKTGLPNPNLDLYRKLIARGIPLVFMNGNYPELTGTLSVLDDNFGGGALLVKYLFEKGHRKIAGIFKNDDIQGHQRYAGYVSAIRELELPLEDRQIFWYGTERKNRLLSGAEGMDEIVQGLDGYTAVVCYNDEIASRLIACLGKKGLAVPADIAVVSFDNSHYSEITTPRITSLSHGGNNVGRLAAELLIRQMQGEACQSQLAPWILVEKESV